MKKILLPLLVLIQLFGCKKNEPVPTQKSNTASPSVTTASVATTGYVPSGLQWRGLDLSFSYKIENQLGQYYHEVDGTLANTFQIAANHGVNLVRLRLMINPPSYLGETSLAAVKAQALRLKALGINFFLDLHYSDVWADPGYQSKPASWSTLTGSSLISQAASYTTDVLTQLKNQGTSPVIVETGNEITNGMLWPDFKINPTSATNWANFASLYNALYAAVKGVDPTIQVMLHLSNYSNAATYFAYAKSNAINYDIMGFSYYSGWTGTNLNDFLTSMNSLVAIYNKPVMIAETAYQFTTVNSDLVTNWFDNTSLTPGYAATMAGQLAYLEQLMFTVKSITAQKGIGICFWGAEWVAYSGRTMSDANYGSSMDNATLFDSYFYRANIGLNAFASTGTNLVNNGTFELDSVKAVPTYWLTWSVNDFDANSTQKDHAYKGLYDCIQYKATPYEIQTYQTVTGLQNGTYSMSAYVISNGGQTYCKMEAKDFGSTTMYTDIQTGTTWHQITIPNIIVTNNQCTVSFYSKAPGGSYLAFDNVTFSKN